MGGTRRGRTLYIIKKGAFFECTLSRALHKEKGSLEQSGTYTQIRGTRTPLKKKGFSTYRTL